MVLKKRRLATQILVRQVATLLATLAVGFGLTLWLVHDVLTHQYEQRALGIARSVAVDPDVAAGVLAGDRQTVQSRAEAVRRSTGALFVVVTDRDGIRYSHPNPSRIGERVSTDPGPALSGQTIMVVERGTLGLSARAKVPLRDAQSRIVGEVSVGIEAGEISSRLFQVAPSIALYSGLALIVGVAASLALARRLKRQTFNLELSEIAELLQEREALLYGIREGVIAFDPQGRVTLVNDEARRLIGPVEPGDRLDAVLPEGRLADVLSGSVSGADEIVLTGDNCLVVNRMPVTLQGRDLGAVVTVRDRTEMEGLLRELDSVRGLTDALRAQQHEFSNRMHTLAGLLELGRHDEATRYAVELAHVDTGLSQRLQERLASTQLVGLLLAKATVAAERGVVLEITDDSSLASPPAELQALLTTVGNLVDNAVDAAAEGDQPALVTVHIQGDPVATLIQITDSGPGIPGEDVFADGYSTKPPRGTARRGLGLALVNHLVQRLGGTIEVTPGPGAVFTVVLPSGAYV